MNEPSQLAKPRVTAKDFFLWLGAMVALYVSTISLILLVHQYIHVLFPDVVLEPYGGTFYSGQIRFAIASLIVFFPLYAWLTRILHQDIRQNPQKKELWVRRWLVFLTLFVAGVAMAIDLVMVINTFLNGELTMRFFLKALTILIVVGSAFVYYLAELRGTWERKEKQSVMIGAITGLLTLALIIGGFFMVGSPMDERMYRIDEQKISDLQNIQWQVVTHWQQKGELPADLSALEDPLSGFVVPRDPETGALYRYTTEGALSFSLCATFNKPSRDVGGPVGRTKVAVPMPVGDDSLNDTWQHETGETCFDRTIDPDKYPPFTKGS